MDYLNGVVEKTKELFSEGSTENNETKFEEPDIGYNPQKRSANPTDGLTREQKAKVNKIVKALSVKNPKINKAKQRQHETAKDAAAATRKDRESHPGIFRWAKSYFTIKMKSAHAATLQRIRDGKYTAKEDFDGGVHLLVDLERNVGFWYNRKDQKRPTTIVRVDYSDKDGYHIYPTGDDKR